MKFEFDSWNRTDRQKMVGTHVCGCNWNIFAAFHLPKKVIIHWLMEPNRLWKVVVSDRGGKRRVCYVPSPILRRVQHSILRRLPSCEGRYATAFEKGCSVAKNAERHKRGRSSLVLDLENAFESVKTKQVFRYLANLNHCRINTDSAWVYARLLTYEGHLRQGPPVSPRIFNRVMGDFDMGMEEAMKTFGVIYTRYADDLCFSSRREVFPDEAESKIVKVVESFGRRLNHKKRRVGSHGKLFFPGAEIVDGVTLPPAGKLEKFATELQRRKEGADNRAVVAGLRGFVAQFGFLMGQGRTMRRSRRIILKRLKTP